MAEISKIAPLGDRGILIDFDGNINEEVLSKVLFYKEIIENSKFKQEVEVTNTYNSLLITYMLTIEDIYSEVLRVKQLLIKTNIPKNTNYRIFHIPVCYDTEFGLDLELISEKKNLSKDEIVRIHTSLEYRIYFIGFLPGFLYLGGLDKKLKIPRKNSPRRSVEKGSVGIGENQTGIYPKSSPGGWQIIGKTPMDLFDKKSDPPSPFKAGDKIKFEAVTKEDFFRIKEELENGNYKLKFEKYES